MCLKEGAEIFNWTVDSATQVAPGIIHRLHYLCSSIVTMKRRHGPQDTRGSHRTKPVDNTSVLTLLLVLVITPAVLCAAFQAASILAGITLVATYIAIIAAGLSLLPSNPKSTKHPILVQKVIASLSTALARHGGVVPSCVIDAFIRPSFIDDRTRAAVVSSLRDILMWDSTTFDRLSAFTRNAHRQRIGPRIAALKTAASLAAIGSSTFLDLFAMRALAIARDVELHVHMTPEHSHVSQNSQSYHAVTFVRFLTLYYSRLI